jgi:hypothetical protein
MAALNARAKWNRLRHAIDAKIERNIAFQVGL